MNVYKFNDKDNKHEHLLWSERKGEYEQLTGVTTIIDVLGKTLTWWASGLAVAKFGWINDKIRENGKVVKTLTTEQRITHLKPIRELIGALDDKDYLSILDDAYKAHSVRLTDSAEEGTDLHAELENYVKWHMAFNLGDVDKSQIQRWSDKVLQFAMWADKNVKKFIWSEGYCYDEILFVGGITDCGAELKDGSMVIIDFKSAKEAYFNHFVQIGIYNLLVEKHGILDKEGNKILKPNEITKYMVVPFGAKEFKVVENNNIKSIKEAGLSCINLYRAKGLFENN